MDREVFGAVVDEVERLAAGRRLEIIELGGGRGRLFDRIEGCISAYVNVEPTAPPLDRRDEARLRDPRFDWIRCSAEELPFDDRSFDLALAIASLDHIPDADRAIAEIARCLRPDGSLIVALNNKASWWKRLLRGTAYLQARERRIAAVHYAQWSARECIEHLRGGFSSVTAHTLIFAPYVPLVWPLLLRLGRAFPGRIAPMGGGTTLAIAKAPLSRGTGRDR